MTNLLTIFSLFISITSSAQKIDSIYFHLYTDSLKKGVHNYINVDGKLSDGTFLPLMDDEVVFKSSVGTWRGNSIILDISVNVEKVTITAILKKTPSVCKQVIIYVKKVTEEAELKTEQEILKGWRKRKA